ncbi:RNA 2',3'-cyclic phosphodiesterase [Candidatus Sumerlaeota bacterium]|nr:RNA 2',3'-cyclic phosphodiesterase [Candidatus Sumerlaeota bacterium]
MNETIRCFLAVEISDEVRQAVARLTENLRKGVQFTRAYPSWVKAENQHFTVVFLGNQSLEQIEQIKAALNDLPQEIAPFAVEVGGLGAFPNERAPRVLWVGVRKGADGFADLYGKVVARLRPIGFEPEKRPYHPHLTLARIKALRGVAEMMDVVRSHRNTSCGEFAASALTLFRSQLHPDGAIYTPLARWEFRRPA